MAEFTKEQLVAEVHYNLEHCFCSEKTKILMEIALAALTAGMEQEPVFFIEVEGDDWIQAGRIPGSTFDFNNLPDGINKLYAAPQLPQPVNDVIESAIGNLRKTLVACNRLNYCGDAVKQLEDACRTAMLQGAEPAQGWIPCSERMPEVGVYVLCLDGLDRHGQFAHDDVYTAAYCDRLKAFTTEYYGDHDWMSKSKPTHWAPIPKISAAPQQEVK